MFQNNQFPANVSISSYTLDAMERPIGLVEQYWVNTNSNTIPPSGSPTTTKTWVQNVTWGPSNEMTGIQFATTAGPLYTETRSYNNLLQLTNITAAGSGLPGMNLSYDWNTAHNNGQVAGINDALSGEQITYTYDLLNRLIQAQTTQNHTQYPNAPWWGQAYTYDGFGNLLTKTPIGPGNSTVMSLSVDPNTNHFTASGYGYDANGNVTTLPQSSGNLALSYDVENRFQMSGGVLMFDMENQPLYDSGAGKYSVWDLNGRRLRHESITIGVNPPAGQAIPNYAITDRNIYFGDRLIQSNSKTVLVDRLGSVRANESGEKFEYLPYGEEFNLTSQNREKFATYTRSSANGLDYAINRWYDSVHGAFVTPDPHTLSMDLSSPGTMNRYAYVGGDPINSTDPQGLDYLCFDGTSAAGFDSCVPDLAEPGLFGADGLGNIPCGDGSMISAFASPAEIANCQAPGLAPEGPAQASYEPPPCDQVEAGYINGYLSRRGSPITPDVSEIVAFSDAEGIDDRFIVALAGAESRYGLTQQNSPTWGYYNVFSNGRHCQALSPDSHCYKVDPYTSYEQAIEDVITLLTGPRYFGKGLTTVGTIYQRYNKTPASEFLATIYRQLVSGVTVNSNVNFSRCP